MKMTTKSKPKSLLERYTDWVAAGHEALWQLGPFDPIVINWRPGK